MKDHFAERLDRIRTNRKMRSEGIVMQGDTWHEPLLAPRPTPGSRLWCLVRCPLALCIGAAALLAARVGLYVAAPGDAAGETYATAMLYADLGIGAIAVLLLLAVLRMMALWPFVFASAGFVAVFLAEGAILAAWPTLAALLPPDYLAHASATVAGPLTLLTPLPDR